jgi:hypothetical protein
MRSKENSIPLQANLPYTRQWSCDVHRLPIGHDDIAVARNHLQVLLALIRDFLSARSRIFLAPPAPF